MITTVIGTCDFCHADHRNVSPHPTIKWADGAALFICEPCLKNGPKQTAAPPRSKP